MSILQLLCIMGEPFEFHGDINGAVVNVRYGGDRICKFLQKVSFLFITHSNKLLSTTAIWTSDAKKKKSILAIGMKLKEYLRLDSNFKLYYEAHSASKDTKPMYTI